MVHFSFEFNVEASLSLATKLQYGVSKTSDKK